MSQNLAVDFINRLLAIEPPVFAIVEGAAEFASIDTRPTALPAAFVLIEGEVSAASERMTGPVLQRSEADVAVILVTENNSDDKGGAAAGDIEALKALTRGALIGFVPASSLDGRPVEHIEGQLLRARNGVIWQREVFGAATYLEEQS